MKKKITLAKKYAEALIYSIIVIVITTLALSSNIYLTMIPLAFILGIIGRIIFPKSGVTTFFSTILALLILQIKTPSLIAQNILKAFQILILVALGELFVYNITRGIRLSKNVKKVKKKAKIEARKCILFSVIFFVLGTGFSAIVNGNYISYFKAKSNLKQYFVDTYASGSRFRITSANYIFDFDNSKYVFYTQDTLSNNSSGKFSVYIVDEYSVQDDYEIKIVENVVSKINNEIEEVLDENYDITVYVTASNVDKVILCFEKTVDSITKEKIEEYSKKIVEYIDTLRSISDFEDIYQIKIELYSSSNEKDNLASYVYMSGYDEMLEAAQEEPYSYIMRALNVEYFE